MPLRHVRDSILEIDDKAWVVADRFMISRQPTAPDDKPSWSDGEGGFYSVDTSLPDRQGHPLPSSSPIQLVHDAGDANVCWKIGDAFLKLQSAYTPARTREHTTLQYLNDPSNGLVDKLDVDIPRVLFHDEDTEHKRYYLITTKVPGVTLENAWPTLTDTAKQVCVDKIVHAVVTLASIKGDTPAISGVDGRQLEENWMRPFTPQPRVFSSDALISDCQGIVMDVSSRAEFVLAHCDLGPTNVLVDVDVNPPSVGIIDWEVFGFVPRAWVRTKFSVCGAMDFDFALADLEKAREWRKRVEFALGERGFDEVADAWRTRYWADYKTREEKRGEQRQEEEQENQKQ